MRIKEIEAIINEFNEKREEAGKFHFLEIIDYSLMNERKKVLHNVLVNKYCRIISNDSIRVRWEVEYPKHTPVFKGHLDACLLYVEKNKLCGRKKRK